MNTAHGIPRIGLARISGKHLSDSSNEAFFVAVDEAMHADKLVDGYAERKERRAMQLQFEQNNRADFVNCCTRGNER